MTSRLLVAAAAGLIWLTTAVAAASAGDGPARVRRPAAPAAPPASIAVADFDADGDPDVARAERSAGHGAAYRIDTALTSRADASVHLGTSQSFAGLEALDVDADRDVDLVLVPLLSPHHVSVLLNDGRGRFTQGDATAERAAASRLRSRQEMRAVERVHAPDPSDHSRRPQVFGRTAPSRLTAAPRPAPIAQFFVVLPALHRPAFTRGPPAPSPAVHG